MTDSLILAELSPRDVSEARLVAVLDTIAEGVVILDEHGRILMFNKACQRLFGYSAHEVAGAVISELLSFKYGNGYHDHDGNPRTLDVHRLIGVGQEIRGRRKDGTIFLLELSMGEMRTMEGLQFIGILHDAQQNNASGVSPCEFPGTYNLTPRERDVLREIAGGASNKEAGRKLGISPRTIEVHRARIMEKLGAKNAADLVRIVLTGEPRLQAKAG